MRFERKYRIEEHSFSEVRAMFRHHPMAFRTLFPDRLVNSIYLDSPDLQFLQENLGGVGVRRKFRIRWYGENREQVTAPVLEIKRKDGELGDKILAKLQDFSVDNFPELVDEVGEQFKGLMLKAAKEPLALPPAGPKDKGWFPSFSLKKDPVIPASQLRPFPALQLQPVVLVSYLRSYLISYDGRYRLTIDRQMNFHAIDGWGQPGQRQWTDNAVVVEIKYEAEHDREYDRVGQYIPFRLSKNSKYVNGMTLVGNV